MTSAAGPIRFHLAALVAVAVAAAAAASTLLTPRACKPNAAADLPRLLPSGDTAWPAGVPRVADTATGVPDNYDDMDLSPEQRRQVFFAVTGGWPPRLGRIPAHYTYRPGPVGSTERLPQPAETEAFQLYHFAKEQALMDIEDRAWRTTRWLEQVQIRTIPQFTRRGYSVVDMPPAIHSKVQQHLFANLKDAPPEDNVLNYLKWVRPRSGTTALILWAPPPASVTHTLFRTLAAALWTRQCAAWCICRKA